MNPSTHGHPSKLVGQTSSALISEAAKKIHGNWRSCRELRWENPLTLLTSDKEEKKASHETSSVQATRVE